jgi:N utilization substance protein B
MKSRTRARSLALQVLYEVDIADHLPGTVLDERLEEAREEDQAGYDQDVVDFARQIIFGVYPLAQKLDEVIAEYAPEWPFDQISAIDRNILRIATWEFFVSGKTPLKVAINEAVELAKYFSSETTSRFVNGVLGSLADHQNIIAQQFKKGD